jgi:hypothetical protein
VTYPSPLPSPEFAVGVIPTFAEFLNTSGNETLYIADGGLLNSLTAGGTLVTNITNTPSIDYIVVHNQRLWGCGDGFAAGQYTSLFYSALNNGDTLGITGQGGGQIIVRTFGDDPIVALASCNSSLLIFHRNGISRLTGFGQDDINVDPEGISSRTGTIAPQSVVTGDGVVFFVSDRGVFAVNESSVVPLGSPNKPDPILPIIGQLTAAQLSQVRAVLSRRTQELWFFFPNAGVYVYHLILQVWAGPWGGEYENLTAMWTSRANSSAELFTMLGAADGVVSVGDYPGIGFDRTIAGTPDVGTPIDWRVQLRRLYFQDESIAKSFRYLYVTAATDNPIQVSWETNFEVYPPLSITPSAYSTWPLDPNAPDARRWDSGRWGGGTGSQNYRLDAWGLGYYIDITFEHDAIDTPILSRVALDAFAVGRR